MASNPTSRNSFIESSILIARSNRLHGLDLAWEYPKRSQKMTNFGKLLQEWHSAVEDESKRTGESCLLLTAAVYYSSEYNSVSYPVQTIIECLDWVNIIAYEFYGLPTEPGPFAALYNPLGRPCGDSGLKQCIKAGLPEKKAVFGFPYVGWSWSFANDDGYDL
ncbi:Class V chitinase [Cardamine amara subsp. amara]|uniref:Class V chitinase n=1 Tax=Cardamine amara subsp. amara TaxID=228776 RepID=A0ABD1B2D1_CARAN